LDGKRCQSGARGIRKHYEGVAGSNAGRDLAKRVNTYRNEKTCSGNWRTIEYRESIGRILMSTKSKGDRGYGVGRWEAAGKDVEGKGGGEDRAENETHVIQKCVPVLLRKPVSEEKRGKEKAQSKGGKGKTQCAKRKLT